MFSAIPVISVIFGVSGVLGGSGVLGVLGGSGVLGVLCGSGITEITESASPKTPKIIENTENTENTGNTENHRDHRMVNNVSLIKSVLESTFFIYCFRSLPRIKSCFVGHTYFAVCFNCWQACVLTREFMMFCCYLFRIC